VDERVILVDRVQDTQEPQKEAQQEFDRALA